MEKWKLSVATADTRSKLKQRKTTYGMRGLSFLLCAVAFIIGVKSETGMAKQNSNVSDPTGVKGKELRAYLPFSTPVDPAYIVTIPDMDISYALAATLVDWDESKQVQSGLAARWTRVDPKTFRFQLRAGAKWSNGKIISAQEVKESFDRAERVHSADLKAFFDQVDSIKVNTAENSIDIHLKAAIADDGILKKLTEPMYGVVKVNSKGELDLSVSSGPYILESSTEHELMLRKNPNWFNSNDALANRIVIRRPIAGASADLETSLKVESWPNIVAAHYLIGEKLLGRIKDQGFEVWRRNLDRVFLLSFYGKKQISPDEAQLFRFLLNSAAKSEVTKGLSGFTEGTQMFPRAYPLYTSDLKCEENGPATLPSVYKGKKLKVLYSPERVSPELLSNFTSFIKNATGSEPAYTSVSISELSIAGKKGDFDVYLGSLGVADPNFEGALSYFFEMSLPTIPSGTGKHDFKTRLFEARRISDTGKKVLEMRKIMSDALCGGYVLPLFHFSTTVIAKPGIDLSQVPTTDESVSFSKVRFKTESKAK